MKTCSGTDTFSRIVVEGPDGSGKSTYIKQVLFNNRTPQVQHNGGPPKSIEDLLTRISAIYSAPDGYVLDRWAPISEIVYGSVLRPMPLLPVHSLLEHIDLHRPLIVYCRPPMTTLLANATRIIQLAKEKDHKPDEHTKQVIENQVAIVQEYDVLMRYLVSRKHNVLRYDYTGEWV